MKSNEQRPQYNLNYRFGADLREVPEDANSMLAYSELMMTEAKKIQKAGATSNLRALVKFLGEAGTYYRILGKTEAANHALEQSLALIDEHKLGVGFWAVHSLRFGEVLRQKQDYLSAETAFKAVLEMSDRHQDIGELKDFCQQHLGKLYFDQKDYVKARQFFEEAMKIRKIKGDQALINSTEFALRALSLREKQSRS